MGVGSSTPLSTGQEQSGGVRVSVKERYHAYLPEGTNFNAELNEQKVKIVHDHWNFIADEKDVGDSRSSSSQSRISMFYDAFYDRLFQMAPNAKERLFQGNMVRQSRALVKMVSWLCNLEVTPDLVTRLEALADRHFEYGCRPFHYYAAGVALQHALRTTTEGEEVSPTVASAWADLYSFVMLIVIPRTALLLEEEVRTAGPVLSTMLRSTPISGTRLKAQKTPPPVWQYNYNHNRGGGGGSGGGSGSGVGMVGEVVDGEWIGAAARRAEAAARVGQIVRSGSGSFTRRMGRSRRHTANRTSNGMLQDLETPGSGVSGGGVRLGGVNVNRGGRGVAGAQCPITISGQGGVFTPGGSPLSTTSSMMSGVQPSMTESVATTERYDEYDSTCASPGGSTTSTGARSRERHRTKLFRGLGRLTGGGLGNGSSPKGSIRSRARAAFGRSRHDGGDDPGSGMSGRSRGKAGAAAPHMPFGGRRGGQAPSISSVPQELTMLATEGECGDRVGSASKTITDGRHDGRGADSSGHSSRHSGRRRSSADRSSGGGRHGGDNSAPFPSPARSTASLPCPPSWAPPSRNSMGSLRARTSVAPTSESPSAVFLAEPDFDWGGVREGSGRERKRHEKVRLGGGRGLRGVGGGVAVSEVGVGRRNATSPHDRRAGTIRSSRRKTREENPRSSTRMPKLPRTPSQPTAEEAARPLQAPKQQNGGPQHLQLPAGELARMESLPFNRNGGGRGRRTGGSTGGAPAKMDGDGESSRRYPGVMASTVRAFSPVNEEMEHQLSSAEDAETPWVEPLEPLVLPLTPEDDEAKSAGQMLVSASAAGGRSGSRRAGRRSSAGSRRDQGSRAQRIDAKSAAASDVTSTKNVADRGKRHSTSTGRPLHGEGSGGKTEIDGLVASQARSANEAAARQWGFLPDPKERATLWRNRPRSSSGADFDQIETSALGYKESKEREKCRSQKRQATNARQQKASNTPASTPSKSSKQQRRRATGGKENVDELSLPAESEAGGGAETGTETETGSVAVCLSKLERVNNGQRQQRCPSERQPSPTPEELAAAETAACYSRQTAKGATCPVRPTHSTAAAVAGGGTPMSSVSACQNSPLAHMAAMGVGMGILISPRTPLTPGVAAGHPVGSPAPALAAHSSPFFALSSASTATGVHEQQPQTSADGGDGGSERSPPRHETQTPPMWVSRQSMMCTTPPGGTPRAISRGKHGVNGGVCLDGVDKGIDKKEAYITPLASPPTCPKDAIATARTVETTGTESMSREPSWGEVGVAGDSLAKGNAIRKMDSGGGSGQAGSATSVEGVMPVEKTAADVADVEAAASIKPPAVTSLQQPLVAVPLNLQPPLALRLSVEPPPDLFGSQQPRRRVPICSMKQQQQHEQQQNYGQRVARSAKPPMSLPPADDDGSCPEADGVGLSPPIVNGVGAGDGHRRDAVACQGGEGTKNSGRPGAGRAELDEDLSEEVVTTTAMGGPFSRPKISCMFSQGEGELGEILRPAEAIRSLPRRSIHSQQSSLWSDSDDLFENTNCSEDGLYRGDNESDSDFDGTTSPVNSSSGYGDSDGRAARGGWTAHGGAVALAAITPRFSRRSPPALPAPSPTGATEMKTLNGGGRGRSGGGGGGGFNEFAFSGEQESAAGVINGKPSLTLLTSCSSRDSSGTGIGGVLERWTGVGLGGASLRGVGMHLQRAPPSVSGSAVSAAEATSGAFDKKSTKMGGSASLLAREGRLVSAETVAASKAVMAAAASAAQQTQLASASASSSSLSSSSASRNRNNATVPGPAATEEVAVKRRASDGCFVPTFATRFQPLESTTTTRGAHRRASLGTRINGLVEALTAGGGSVGVEGWNRGGIAGTATAGLASGPAASLPNGNNSNLAPSYKVFVAESRPTTGRVAAAAASFTAAAHNGGKGGGGFGGAHVGASSDVVSGGGSGVSKGRGRGEDAGVGGTRQAGPIEGLAFGSVRAKASAWGKAWER